MRLRVFFLIMLLHAPAVFAETLLIGTSPFNPPFVVWTGQERAFGFDMDLMRQLCERMSVTCKFVPASYNDLFYAFRVQKLDLLISSIIITEIRRREFLFSLPYLASNAQYMGNANTPLNTISDITGKKIGVRMGTPYIEVLKLVNEYSNTLIEYGKISDVFSALENGEIDVCLVDYETARYWVATNPGIYKLIGGKVSVGEGYGIMAESGNSQLITRVNDALLSMQRDGSYLRMYSQYFD